MNTSTKTKRGPLRGLFLIAAFVAVILGINSSFASQANDQIAIQLGAIQANVDLSTATDAQKLQLLLAGRSALALNVAKNAGAGTPEFQQQLFEATQRALTNPQTFITKYKRKKIKLTPIATRANSVLALAVKRLPNYAPMFAANSVTAALANNAGVPILGPVGKTLAKTQARQLGDANKSAGIAMTYALLYRPKGTPNWAAGTLNYNPARLADYASAVAAQAVGALRASALGLQNELANVTSMTTALTRATLKTQKTSLLNSTFNIGSLGGAIFGVTTQVAQAAGAGNFDWNNGTVNPLLQGVIKGALAAKVRKGAGFIKARSYLSSILLGVVHGFTMTYLGTTDATQRQNDQMETADQFITQNLTLILDQFKALALPKMTATQYLAYQTAASDMIKLDYTSVNSGQIGSLDGSGTGGIVFDNGTLTPVTDAQGV